VTNRRRNGKKKNKKGEEEEKQQKEHDGQAGFGGRAGQFHGRDYRNKRSHVGDEIVPFDHSHDVASVALFVTNEQEEDALRAALKDRPFEIVGVATLEKVAHFENAERQAKVRVVKGIEDVRALMKELGVSIFVLPVDDERLPAPRMSEDVSAILDVAVRAGAYALTVTVSPLPESTEPRLFVAAVPTQESMQLLINTLGVVDDEVVRQNFELNGFDIPEKAGLFDIYTSLMNSALKKYKTFNKAEVIPNGDQFIQDIAAQTKKPAHYPVFTVSFKVGKLANYTSPKSNRDVYEITCDDVVPDTLKNIFILLGVSLRTKLTLIVCKYQGHVDYQCEDPDKKVDVEFEKIIYSYSSLTDTPIYELYLPRYVDPAAAAAAAAAAPAPAAAAPAEAAAAAAPATEEASK